MSIQHGVRHKQIRRTPCILTILFSTFYLFYHYALFNIRKVRIVMVSNATLAKIAAYGGLFVVGTGYLMGNKIEEGIKKSDYFRESMKQLRAHQGVVSLFGEPIKAGRLDLGKTETNFCDGTRAQFQVPVKGPKAKGTLHLWAERTTYEQPWDVYRLKLELKDLPDRMIVLRNVPSKCASSEGL